MYRTYFWDLEGELLQEADLLNTIGRQYEYILLFLSHCWGAPEGWLMSETFANVKIDQMYSIGQDILRNERLCPSHHNSQITMWVDKVSSPQGGEQFKAVEKFGYFFIEYLAIIPHMVVLLSPNYFGRLWCLFEFATFLMLHPPANLLVGFDSFTMDDDPRGA
jgi:hypothetical protein